MLNEMDVEDVNSFAAIYGVLPLPFVFTMLEQLFGRIPIKFAGFNNSARKYEVCKSDDRGGWQYQKKLSAQSYRI